MSFILIRGGDKVRFRIDPHLFMVYFVKVTSCQRLIGRYVGWSLLTLRPIYFGIIWDLEISEGVEIRQTSGLGS